MEKRVVLLLLFLSLAATNLQSVNATSENFQLIPGAYVVKVFELQKGDCFEGSFNVSTLYSYRSSFDNRIYTYWVAVNLRDTEENVVANYPKLDDRQLYRFNLTANLSGSYSLSFHCGDNFFPTDAIVPQITLDYNITSSAQPSASPMNTAYSNAGYFLLAALTVILIGAILLLYIKHRGKIRAKNSDSRGEELPFRQQVAAFL
jgi:hypothetical protein